MSVHFRAATEADLPAVIALLADDALGQTRESGRPDDYRAAFAAMQAEAGNHLIVGTSDAGDIIACYQLTLISGLSLSAARRAQIEGVRVAPGHRGGGIGAALLADAEGRARAGGARLMQLTSNAARTDARRFYERAGYAASHIGFKKPLDP